VTVCACADPTCRVLGCAIGRSIRPSDEPAPVRFAPPAQFFPLDEEAVRRIVREELERRARPPAFTPPGEPL
jgi:hypothetical protein